MTEEFFWSQRYAQGQTGWDIGQVSTPLKAYIDQLKDLSIKILIPGAGNAYEASYLWNLGYRQTHILDISPLPLNLFQEKHPDFPDHQIHQEDFFEHQDTYDLILEQTFFCSFPPTPENRTNYARSMHARLKPGGKLVGVWFSFPLTDRTQPPFGGSREEYLTYFKPFFQIHTFEPCVNSIPPRQGIELFAIMQKNHLQFDSRRDK